MTVDVACDVLESLATTLHGPRVGIESVGNAVAVRVGCALLGVGDAVAVRVGGGRGGWARGLGESPALLLGGGIGDALDGRGIDDVGGL